MTYDPGIPFIVARAAGCCQRGVITLAGMHFVAKTRFAEKSWLYCCYAENSPQAVYFPRLSLHVVLAYPTRFLNTKYDIDLPSKLLPSVSVFTVFLSTLPCCIGEQQVGWRSTQSGTSYLSAPFLFLCSSRTVINFLSQTACVDRWPLE